MHLPQIAALPMVADDLTESAHAAQPVLDGEGFLSVFGGGPATRLPEPSGPEPLVVLPSARSAFAELAQAPNVVTPEPATVASELPGVRTAGEETPGAETLEGEPEGGETADGEWARTLQAAMQETAKWDLPPRAELAVEPTNARQPPREGTRARVAGEGALEGGLFTGRRSAEQTPDTVTDIAPGQNRVLTGPVVPVVVPGATQGGANPDRVPEVLVQVDVPGRTDSVKANGAAQTLIGADPSQTIVSEESDVARRALHTSAPGSEKAVQMLPMRVPDVAGSTVRRGALPVDPRMKPTDPKTRGSAQLAGAALLVGAPPPGGQGYPDGPSEGRSTTSRAADPPAPFTAPHHGAGAVKADAVVQATNVAGQTTSVATGKQMTTGSRDAPSAARGSRAETRYAAEAVTPATSGTSWAEMSAMQPSAATVPPAGSGAPAGAAAPVAAGTPDMDDGLFSADPAISEIGLGDGRGPARGPTAAALPVLQSPDTPRHIALQIAEVLRASGDRAVELRLQPEELGRVQLTMSQDATGTLTVSLNVERAETLDLLRRNIDLLGADLRELGYESIDFSFQGDGAGAQQDARPESDDGQGAVDADAASTTVTPQHTAGHGAQATGDGIDIRL